MRVRASLAALVAAAVLVLAAGCGGEPDSQTRLRIGYLANITNAAALVGKKDGIFARDIPGRDVEFVKFSTGTEAVSALLAGSIDASYLGMGPVVISASRAPGQLRVVAGASEAGAVLVVRRGRGIRTLEDLVGRKVGFPGYGNTQDLSLQWELARVGVKGGREAPVTTVRVRNADLRTAFQRGALDAALCPEPWGSQLVAEGLADVLLPADRVMGDGRYPSTVLVVRGSYAAAHPDVVQQLERANRQAVAASADPQRVADAFVASVKTSIDRDVLLRGIAASHPTTDINPRGVSRMITAANRAGYLRGRVTVADVTPVSATR